MKNIISFSLWGDNPKYTQGALENIKLQKQFYPNWVCRFYVHKDININILNQLSVDSEIVMKNEIPENDFMDKPGWFWRFDVLKDHSIDRVIIRDTDSRLSQRERNCVTDWTRSNKSFHIIRDNIEHDTRIMAGMWGATKEFINSIDYDDLINQFRNMKFKNMYATDQEFLARCIYPLIKNNCVIHSDWIFFNDETIREIPHMKINNDFIGKSFN